MIGARDNFHIGNGKDLREIYQYIAADNPKAALNMSKRLEQEVDRLARLPGLGHRRRDVTNESYRFWTVRPYVIVYRYNDETMTVLRVLHGHRDFRKLK